MDPVANIHFSEFRTSENIPYLSYQCQPTSKQSLGNPKLHMISNYTVQAQLS